MGKKAVREAVHMSKGVQKTHKVKDPPKTRVSGKSKPVESPVSSTTTATSRKGQPFVYTTPVDKRTPAIKSPPAASEKLRPELSDAMKMNKVNEAKAAKQKGKKDVHTAKEKGRLLRKRRKTKKKRKIASTRRKSTRRRRKARRQRKTRQKMKQR